ncbi:MULTISPECIES: hypothetical protein [unclassified Natrinema]|uniref:hypothetical protein n=1 Tax=unclassified Natrinema TaxID=2622230 RepID=UPI0011AE2681|nr:MULTISPECIES: hypothetical protein [unclassified Natrinema]
MVIRKRDFLKQLGIGTAALSTIPVASAASEDTDEPIEKLAVTQSGNDEHNLLAFTAFEENTLCLHLATGTSSVDTPATEITQLTNTEDGSIWNLQWKDPSTLNVWKNGKVYDISITPDGDVTKWEKVKDQSFPGGLSDSESGTSMSSSKISSNKTQGVSASASSSETPDWFDDPDFHKGPIEKCDSIKKIGVEWAELCIKTDSVSPKFYTKSCTGYEQPLVGTSTASVSITTPAGGGSVGLDLWTGVDPETGCVYAGSEAANVCVSDCFSLDPLPTVAEMEEKLVDDLMDIFEGVENKLDDIADLPWGKYAETVFKVLALIVVLILFALLEIVTGGSVGA